MDDKQLLGLEMLVRLQTRALQDLAHRLERTESELASVKAASERTAAVASALLAQLQEQQRGGLVAFMDKHPWPALGIAVVLLLFLTNQLYLLPQLAPALGGIRATP